MDLARHHVDQPRVAQQQVDRLIAAGGGEGAGQVAHPLRHGAFGSDDPEDDVGQEAGERRRSDGDDDVDETRHVRAPAEPVGEAAADPGDDLVLRERYSPMVHTPSLGVLFCASKRRRCSAASQKQSRTAGRPIAPAPAKKMA